MRVSLKITLSVEEIKAIILDSLHEEGQITTADWQKADFKISCGGNPLKEITVAKEARDA